MVNGWEQRLAIQWNFGPKQGIQAMRVMIKIEDYLGCVCTEFWGTAGNSLPLRWGEDRGSMSISGMSSRK